MDKYLPDPPQETRLVQASVGLDSYEAVNKYRKEKGLTWNQLMDGMFRRLMDEVAKRGHG